MSKQNRDAFKNASLGAENAAYEVIADLDPEYFERLKDFYVDGTLVGKACFRARSRN